MLRPIAHALVCLLLASAALAQSQLRVVSRFAMEKSSDAVIGADDSRLIMGDGKGDVISLAPDLKQQWSVRLKSGISAPPVIGPAGIILGDDAGHVDLLDPATGATKWSFKTEGKIVGRPAFASVADEPRIVAGSYDTHVYCLSAKDGKEIWRFKTDAQVHASPLLAGGLAIVGGCDGHLRAIALDTGKEKWSTDLGGAIATSPAFHDDRILAATMAGQAFAVGLDGKMLWSTRPLPESEAITASPAVVGDLVVFISDGGQLVSLKTIDGSRVASTRLSGRPSVNLLTLADNILAGTDDGKVLLIDPRSAQIVHRATVGGSVHTLAFVDGKVAACTSEGVLWLLGSSRQD